MWKKVSNSMKSVYELKYIDECLNMEHEGTANGKIWLNA